MAGSQITAANRAPASSKTRRLSCLTLTTMSAASSLITSGPASVNARVYSGVCKKPGMRTGCQVRMYVASDSRDRKSPRISRTGCPASKSIHQPRLLLSRASFSSSRRSSTSSTSYRSSSIRTSPTRALTVPDSILLILAVEHATASAACSWSRHAFNRSRLSAAPNRRLRTVGLPPAGMDPPSPSRQACLATVRSR